MLSNFFALDPPFKEFDAPALVSHLEISRDLRSVLYKSDEWPSAPKSFKAITFKNVSLSKTIFRKVTFTECKFEDCLLIGSTFENVEFHRCDFRNCNFYKSTFTDCYIDPGTIFFDRQYRQKMANVGVQLFQQLYENSSKSRQSIFEMRADIEFRRWKRSQLSYDRKVGKISEFERKLAWVCSIFYEALAGFGYKPWRFVGATLILFTVVSVLNLFVFPDALKLDGQVVHDLTWPDSLFYTYSLMTTLGFSTVVPVTSWAKLLAVSEALVGIGWLGIFTSLLVKRFIK